MKMTWYLCKWLCPCRALGSRDYVNFAIGNNRGFQGFPILVARRQFALITTNLPGSRQDPGPANLNTENILPWRGGSIPSYLGYLLRNWLYRLGYAIKHRVVLRNAVCNRYILLVTLILWTTNSANVPPVRWSETFWHERCYNFTVPPSGYSNTRWPQLYGCLLHDCTNASASAARTPACSAGRPPHAPRLPWVAGRPTATLLNFAPWLAEASAAILSRRKMPYSKVWGKRIQHVKLCSSGNRWIDATSKMQRQRGNWQIHFRCRRILTRYVICFWKTLWTTCTRTVQSALGHNRLYVITIFRDIQQIIP